MNVPLDCKDYIKYLGILIDSNPSWKIHTEYIALKNSKIVGLIAKLRHFVPLHTLLNIYQSLLCIRLERGKFESTNQDLAGGKNSSVLMQS